MKCRQYTEKHILTELVDTYHIPKSKIENVAFFSQIAASNILIYLIPPVTIAVNYEIFVINLQSRFSTPHNPQQFNPILPQTPDSFPVGHSPYPTYLPAPLPTKLLIAPIHLNPYLIPSSDFHAVNQL